VTRNLIFLQKRIFTPQPLVLYRVLYRI